MLNDNNDFLEEMFSSQPVATNDLPDTDFDPEDEPITPEEADDVPDTDEPAAEETGDALIENYVKFLQEYDLIDIPEDYEFTGDPEQLQTILEHTKQARPAKAIETIFERLPDDFKPLFDYALKGGTSLDEYLKVYNKDIDNMSMDTPEDQKKILFTYYKETSPYSDEKINRLISHFNDEDELKVEADDAYNYLMGMRNKQREELLQQTEAQRVAEQARIEQQTISLNKAIEETNAIHPARKNKVKAFFFEPLQSNNTVTTGFNATINSILSNPEHQAQLADILLEYNPEAGFSSDRLERRVKSKATQDFKTLVKSKLDPKQAQRSSSSKAPQSTSFNPEE